MSIEKSEVKQLTAQEIGRKIESTELESKTQLNNYDGAIKALMSGIDCLNKHKQVWQNLMNEKKILSSEYEVSQKVIVECVGILNNLCETAKMQKFIKQGEVSAYVRALDFCETLFNSSGR